MELFFTTRYLIEEMIGLFLTEKFQVVYVHEILVIYMQISQFFYLYINSVVLLLSLFILHSVTAIDSMFLCFFFINGKC